MLAWPSVLLLAAPLHAETIANYTGTTGDWNAPSNWSSNPYYPNNSQPGGPYDAYVAATPGNLAANLVSNIEIDRLYVDYGGFVAVENYTLTLDQGSTIYWPNAVTVGGGPPGATAANLVAPSGEIFLGNSTGGGTLTAASPNTPLALEGFIIGHGTVSNFDISPPPGYGNVVWAQGGTLTIDTTNGSFGVTGDVIAGTLPGTVPAATGVLNIKGPNFTSFDGTTLSIGEYYAESGSAIQFDNASGLRILNSAQVFLDGGVIQDQSATLVMGPTGSGNGTLGNLQTLEGYGGVSLADGNSYTSNSGTLQNNGAYTNSALGPFALNIGLNLSNGSQLTLTNLYGTGNASLTGGSTLTVTGNLGDGHTDNSLVDQFGTLNGNLQVDSSTLNYTGANILTVPYGETLELNGSFSIQNGGSDGVGGLNTNNGMLIFNGATGHTFDSPSGFTNNYIMTVNSSNLSFDPSLLPGTPGFTNYGVLTTNNSTLTFGGDFTNNNEVISAGDSYTFNGNVYNNNIITHDFSTIAYNGNVTNTGFGSLTLQDGTTATLASGQTFDNQGSLTLLGGAHGPSTLDVSAGNFVPNDLYGNLNHGTYEIDDGSLLKYSGDGVTQGSDIVNNYASITLRNDGTIASGSVGGGLLNVSTGNGLNSLVENYGSLTLDNTKLITNGDFDNPGTLTLLNAAKLTISGNFLTMDSFGSLNAGTFNLSGGSTLQYTGLDITTLGTYSSVTLSDTSQIVNLNGVSHDALAGSFTTNQGSFTLQNNASLTLTAGDFTTTNTGNLYLSSGSTLTVANGNYWNQGYTSVDGQGTQLSTPQNYNNQSGYTGVTNGGTITANAFTNAGTLVIGGNGGAAAMVATTGGNFTNSGSVDIQNAINGAGTLTVAQGYSYVQTGGTTQVDGTLIADLIDIEAGTISGMGTIMGNTTPEATIDVYGTFSDATGGPLNVGTDNVNIEPGGTLIGPDPAALDVYSLDLYPNSVTMLYIDSATSYDSIDATNGIMLGGTLELIFENGFVPGSGEMFNLFSTSSGTVSGGFGQVELVNLPGFSLAGGINSSGEFVGTVSPSSVPEPGTYGLLIAGFCAGMIYRARTRQRR